MSMPTLSEIVSSALKQVSEDVPSVKLASSSDVSDPTFDLINPSPSASKSEEKVAAATTTEVLDDGAYALKLASCLEVAGGLLRKQSAEGNAVAVLEATNNAPVTLSPAPKGPVEKAVTTSAPVVAGPMPDSEGDHTGDPDWTSDKEAAEEMVTHKIAQAQLLEELGKHEEAAGLIEEAEKVAKGWLDVKDEKGRGRASATLLGIKGGLLAAVGGAGLAEVLREKAVQKAIAKNPHISVDKLPKNKLLTAALIAGGAAVGGGLSGYGGMRLGQASARAAQSREKELAELIVATQNKTSAESEKLAVSNKWIADKLVRGSRGVPFLVSNRFPGTKAQARLVLSGMQAMGGKKARNAAAKAVIEQTRNLKGKGVASAFNYLNNPSKKQIMHTVTGARAIKNRVGAIQGAIRKTAAEAGSLSTEEAVPSVIPDNAGMIALTAAKARKKTQEEAAQFLTQPVQSDPVIEAEVQNTEGAKVSSLLNAVQIRDLV